MTLDEIEARIRLIPCGEAMTYSQITPSACAKVGSVQRNEPDGWHRVVYKDGSLKYPEQRWRLKAEGIEVVGNKVARKHLPPS